VVSPVETAAPNRAPTARAFRALTPKADHGDLSAEVSLIRNSTNKTSRFSQDAVEWMGFAELDKLRSPAHLADAAHVGARSPVESASGGTSKSITKRKFASIGARWLTNWPGEDLSPRMHAPCQNEFLQTLEGGSAQKPFRSPFPKRGPSGGWGRDTSV
jgi:hypothetical protein